MIPRAERRMKARRARVRYIPPRGVGGGGSWSGAEGEDEVVVVVEEEEEGGEKDEGVSKRNDPYLLSCESTTRIVEASDLDG